MMTRKHFEKTASLIKSFTALTEKQRSEMAEKFSDMYAEENPNFKKKIFIKACGIGITEVKK
tara:strand:+ start:129 stop:314 length:186 start_codon:yes stop_codon:yes gene_type:complete